MQSGNNLDFDEFRRFVHKRNGAIIDVDSEDAPLVNPAKRRRMVAEFKASNALAKERAKAALLAAWAQVRAHTPRPCTSLLDGFAVHSSFERPAPCNIDPSHTAIGVGGFFACIWCGSFSSMRNNKKLSKPCTRLVHTGSKGAILHLMKRELPSRQFQQWPNGELNPVPYLWVPEAAMANDQDGCQGSNCSQGSSYTWGPWRLVLWGRTW